MDLQAPAPQCPKCAVPKARWLEQVSLTNGVNTFRCEMCGHIWTTRAYDAATSTQSRGQTSPVASDATQ